MATFMANGGAQRVAMVRWRTGMRPTTGGWPLYRRCPFMLKKEGGRQGYPATVGTRRACRRRTAQPARRGARAGSTRGGCSFKTARAACCLRARGRRGGGGGGGPPALRGAARRTAAHGSTTGHSSSSPRRPAAAA
jgi:hypothetical protein